MDEYQDIYNPVDDYSLSHQVNMSNYQQMQQNAMMREEERSMIRDQLDLSDELEHLEHLLRGEILKKKDDGTMEWLPPPNNDLVLLSDYGIHLVMNTINFYINKNTLLSNYTEEQILVKMEDFATDLCDTIFMEYEKVFSYPSLEDCIKVLDKRIERKTELRKYAYRLTGHVVDEKIIRSQLIKEMEDRIEKELEKIKETIIKNKLKRFILLIRVIQDAVHSTYNRAWNGAERRTLRQHIQISEINTAGGLNGRTNQPSSTTSLNPLKWFTKR